MINVSGKVKYITSGSSMSKDGNNRFFNCTVMQGDDVLKFGCNELTYNILQRKKALDEVVMNFGITEFQGNKSIRLISVEQ